MIKQKRINRNKVRNKKKMNKMNKLDNYDPENDLKGDILLSNQSSDSNDENLDELNPNKLDVSEKVSFLEYRCNEYLCNQIELGDRQ